MDFKDYYEILGLKKGASAKEIRSSYRKLARKYHPDVNKDNAEAEKHFKEVNEANEVLSDPDKRKLYDELGPRWRDYEQYRAAGGEATPAEFLRGSAFSGASPGSRPHGTASRTMSEDDLRDLFGDSSPFSDFFNQTFGRSRGRTGGAGGRATSAQIPGQDIEQAVEVTLAEAVKGATRILQWSDQQGQRRLEATIPAGVRSGSRIRLAGQGGRGYNGGPNGDLYLVVAIDPHPLFDIKDDDIHVDVPVELHICMLGGEALVPTPKGSRLALTVPPETQNGRVFRLSGQGMPAMRAKGKAGDLYARVQVVLPTHLSSDERELFQRLAVLRGGKSTTKTGTGTRTGTGTS